MASLNSYVSIVERFYNKYSNLLGPILKQNITAILDWVKDYPVRMNTTIPAQTRMSFLKRGVNLLKTLVVRYKTERDIIEQQIIQCQFESLKSGTCTAKTLNSLKQLNSDYSTFISDMMGCLDKTNTMMLSIFKIAYKHFDGDYQRQIESLELDCMDIELHLLRN